MSHEGESICKGDTPTLFLIKKNDLYLFGNKYSYRIQIIFKQIYFTHRWDSNRYYPQGQSEPGGNCNEEVLSTLPIFRTGASPSDAVKSHSKIPLFVCGDFTSFLEIQLTYSKPI